MHLGLHVPAPGAKYWDSILLNCLFNERETATQQIRTARGPQFKACIPAGSQSGKHTTFVRAHTPWVLRPARVVSPAGSRSSPQHRPGPCPRVPEAQSKSSVRRHVLATRWEDANT